MPVIGCFSWMYNFLHLSSALLCVQTRLPKENILFLWSLWFHTWSFVVFADKKIYFYIITTVCTFWDSILLVYVMYVNIPNERGDDRTWNVNVVKQKKEKRMKIDKSAQNLLEYDKYLHFANFAPCLLPI